MTAVNKAREKFLLLQIQQQADEASFTEVYEYLVDPLYRFIFFKIGDTERAQELTSEVFLKCWRELTAKQTQIKHLRAYFYMTARNLVVDFYRQKSGDVPLETAAEVSSTDETVRAVEVRVDSDRVLQVVRRLKSSYQEVILLHYVDRMSLREISHILQKSAVATRVLLHRANQALKREYEQVTK